MNMGKIGMGQGFKFFIGLLCVSLWGSDLAAQPYGWTPTAAGPFSWSAAANWTGTPPAGGPDLLGITVNLNSNITVGQTINLFNTGDSGDAVKTVGTLIFGDSNGSHGMTLASGSGGGTLNFDGNGSTAILTQASTTTGGTDAITAPITLSSDLQITGGKAFATAFTIGSATAGGAGVSSATAGLKTITMKPLTNGTISLRNVTDGAGQIAIVQDGAGKTSMSGTGGFTGGITITSGTLESTTDAALGNGSGSVNAITLNGGTFSGFNGTITNTEIIVNGGSISGTTGSNASFNNYLHTTNGSSLKIGGAGVILGNTTTGFNGDIDINSGGLSFTTAGMLNTGTIRINNAGAFIVGTAGNKYSTGTAALASGKIATTSTGALVLGAGSSEAIDLTGYDTLMLGGNGNFTGTITPANNVYRLGGRPVSGSPTTFTLANVNQLTGARSLVVGNGSAGVDAGLSNSNDYSGGTTVTTGGTLFVSHSNALGTGAVTVNAPTASSNSGLRISGGLTIANNLSLAGVTNDSTLGVLYSSSGANTWSGDVSLAATARIAAANVSGSSLTISGDVALGASSLTLLAGTSGAYVGGDIIVSGDISGTGSVSKGSSSGTVTLSGANTYSGATNISGGMLALGSASALGSGAGTLTINAGNGVTAGVRSNDGTARSISNLFAISSGNATNTYVFGESSGGTGNLTFTNAGTTSLGTVVRTFQVNNRSQFNGIFSGTGAGINKTGNGILVLNGANTYTGATTVSSGTLLVNGSLATTSAVSVSSGATLGGSGRVGAVSGAGMVGPGNSPGILRATSIDPSGGMDYSFQLAVATPTWSDTVNSGNDVLRLDGATPITTAMTSANEFNLYFTGGGVFVGGLYTDVNTDFTSLISSATFNYYLLDGAGSISYDGQNYSVLDPGDVTWDVVQIASADFASGTINNGWAMEFNVTAIPEPSTYALFGLGLAALAMLRRKKK